MRGRRAAAAAPMTAALLLLVTACGSEGAGGSSDAPGPSGSSSPVVTPGSPSPSPSTVPRERVLDVVALSGAAGETESTLVPVALPADADAYAARLPAEVRGPLRAAIDDASVPPGLELQAAVVAVGCDEPADVLLGGGGGRPWTARAVPPKTTVQCLVPVTFVALVGVPS